jgi:hypothetical protein
MYNSLRDDLEEINTRAKHNLVLRDLKEHHRLKSEPKHINNIRMELGYLFTGEPLVSYKSLAKKLGPRLDTACYSKKCPDYGYVVRNSVNGYPENKIFVETPVLEYQINSDNTIVPIDFSGETERMQGLAKSAYGARRASKVRGARRPRRSRRARRARRTSKARRARRASKTKRSRRKK